MRCSDCENWNTVRKTIYDDGGEIVTWTAPEGKGHCLILKLDTDPDFGCVLFRAGSHERITYKPGEPWQHHHDIPCPDCNGTGCVPDTFTINKWACHRCCGCGRVRQYDDGYIGEEKTRLHPKEKQFIAEGKEIPPLPGTTLAPLKKPDATDTGGMIS